MSFAAEGPLRFFDRSLQRRGTGAQGEIAEILGEGVPTLVAEFACGEIGECGVSELAESFRIEIVQRHADDPASGNESCAREMKQARQQFSLCQIAGGANEHNHLRKTRTDAVRNLCHGSTIPFKHLRRIVPDPPGCCVPGSARRRNKMIMYDRYP